MDNKPITHTSPALRIGVVIVISFVLDITFRFLGYLSILAMPWFGGYENYKNVFLRCIEVGMDYLPLILLVFILMRWKKSMYSGNKLWFNKIRPSLFILILLFIVTIPLLVVYLIIPVFAIRILKYLWTVKLDLETMNLQPSGLTMFIQCMVWLWWCDSQPRRLRSLLYGFFIWSLYAGMLLVMLWPVIVAFKYKAHDIVILIQEGITIRHIAFQYFLTITIGCFAFIIYRIQAAIRRIINKKI